MDIIGRESDFFSIIKYFFALKGCFNRAFLGGASKLEMLEKLISGITLQPENIPNWLVIVMGIGTVFVGLIAIIIICKIMSLFFVKRKPAKKEEIVAAPAPTTQVIQNRQEIIAAVCAVAAEELGTDISAIRILSFKKI